ncbi:MAG: hypothetical protein ACLP9L_19480 [Thermoguttaceae bacterium]
MEISATPAPTQAAKARIALETANASFDFTTVTPMEQDAPWEGTIGRGGLLRLVASSGGKLYVAVLKLEVQQR